MSAFKYFDTLEEGWQEYVQSLVNDKVTLTTDQLERLRQAFFCGAGITVGMMLSTKGSGMKNATAKIKAINNEIATELMNQLAVSVAKRLNAKLQQQQN